MNCAALFTSPLAGFSRRNIVKHEAIRPVRCGWVVMLGLMSGCGIFDVGVVVKACNALTHEGCTASEACISPENPECAPIGNIAVGQACAGISDCVREAVCVGSDNVRFCRARCDLAAPSCPSDKTCVTSTKKNNPSGMGVCGEVECDPVGQTGCASDQHCIPGPLPYCTAVKGVIGDGLPCNSSESCRVGFVCAETKGESRCIVVCTTEKTGAESGCGEDYACKGLLDGDGHKLPAGQGTCELKHCNALTDFGCDDSEKCFTAVMPVCGFPGNAQLDEICAQAKDCGIGLICLKNSEGAQTCRAKCDTSAADAVFACPDGFECVEIPTNGAKMPNHVGYCRVN